MSKYFTLKSRQLSRDSRAPESPSRNSTQSMTDTYQAASTWLSGFEKTPLDDASTPFYLYSTVHDRPPAS